MASGDLEVITSNCPPLFSGSLMSISWPSSLAQMASLASLWLISSATIYAVVPSATSFLLPSGKIKTNMALPPLKLKRALSPKGRSARGSTLILHRYTIYVLIFDNGL